MTGPLIPAPRPALDDELERERAVAAADTRRRRQDLDALGGALDAIGRLMAGETA